jgi:hypothetical protein
MKFTLLAPLVVSMFLAACQTSPSARLGEPQFTGPAFSFAAGRVDLKKSAELVPMDVQSKYQFPTSIDTGVEKWAASRLRAAGGANRLEVDILHSSVTEETLPVEKGFMGAFKDDQNRRYTARLKLALNLYSPDRYTARAGVASEVHRSTTLPESASLAQRQQAFNDLVIGLLQQMDIDLSQRIPQYLQPYLAGY